MCPDPAVIALIIACPCLGLEAVCDLTYENRINSLLRVLQNRVIYDFISVFTQIEWNENDALVADY